MFFDLNSKFDIVYDKYADMLYRLAFSYLKNREDAEDVVHDVFIKYMKSFRVLSDEQHVQRWLVRVTVNCSHDVLRKKSYRNHSTLDEITEEASETDDAADSLMESVSQLPEKYRIAVMLHYFEGYSVEETAKILHKSESAVKMRLSRGRELLKKILEQEGTYV